MTLIVNVIQNNNRKDGSYIEDLKPVLFAGINVFLSGYWRKEQVISIDINDSNGKIYTVHDCENGITHVLSKYLFRPNMLYLEGGMIKIRISLN
jgi:hypothetical protein